MQPTLTRLTLEHYQHRLPLCRIYLHTAGKKEEKAEFESAHESSLIKAITSVRRKIATFLRVFVVSKNKLVFYRGVAQKQSASFGN